MNWIKLPIVGTEADANTEAKESVKGEQNTKIINLDFCQTIEPIDNGEQSILFQQDGRYVIADIPFEILSNHIKPILTVTDLSGNEL